VFAQVNEASTSLEAALLYAGADSAVFPLHTPIDAAGTCSCGKSTCTDQGKHPKTSHGCKDASVDPETIRRWLGAWPDANIGMTVPASHVVIDIDDLEAGRALEQRGALSPTLTARSGSGGGHMVYALPEGVTLGNSTGELPAGIHVRGAGGYIVVAPSFHKSGNRYQWVGIRPIAPIPGALLDLIQPKPNPQRTLPPIADGELRRFITSGRVILQGNRNQELYRRGCAARGYGYDDHEILTAVDEINQQCCQPPVSDAEVQKIARQICQRPRGGRRDA
jgi:Bifunctional DNA primase/polymerase, N-terminal/Primase C terminal 1 (PriCT-1)